jgi:transcriptional regulator with XRE-family HTH domain
MENPITKIRKSLNLEISQLAKLAGVAMNTIRWNERGENMEITPKLLTFLTDELGFDEEKLVNDYARFREWKRQQLLESIKEKIAK